MFMNFSHAHYTESASETGLLKETNNCLVIFIIVTRISLAKMYVF